MTLQRRTQIAELMQNEGALRVSELARRFGVSQVTIRNDLMQLEREGHLVRDRGGALPPPDSGPIISSLLEFEARTLLGIEEKARIGIAASKMVTSGDTILLDAGTTVVEMARHLSGISPLTVVTNALNVAYHVGTTTNAQLLVLGGTFYREAASMLGPLTERGLSDFVVSKLFLGAQAFDLEHGLTDTTLEIAGVKRAMIRSARQVILMADSSKFGRSGFIKVAPFSEIDVFITDTGLADEAREGLEGLDVEVILV
ncbi:DeoR/GlpR transcriptional regulator [bacterium]|nr:MAG: DeoR/GlpR transcriptional regulator [bacterium]